MTSQLTWNILESVIKPFGLVAFRRDACAWPEATQGLLLESVAEVALMRVGNTGDGGYWIPRNVPTIDSLLSGGIGGDWAFESELESLYPRISIQAIDPRPEPEFPYRQVVGLLSSVKSGGHFLLDDIANQLPGQMVLKLDIEGNEYKVVNRASETSLNRAAVIVMELHELSRLLDRVWVSAVFEDFAVKLLLNHTVVWRAQNPNDYAFRAQGHRIPKTLEVTLLRNDLLPTRGASPLDQN